MRVYLRRDLTLKRWGSFFGKKGFEFGDWEGEEVEE